MEKKFQPLTLEKFSSALLGNTWKVLGGKGSDIPNGGASCPTGGDSNDHYTFTSDTAVYDGNGALYQTDHHGVSYHSDS